MLIQLVCEKSTSAGSQVARLQKRSDAFLLGNFGRAVGYGQVPPACPLGHHSRLDDVQRSGQNTGHSASQRAHHRRLTSVQFSPRTTKRRLHNSRNLTAGTGGNTCTLDCPDSVAHTL